MINVAILGAGIGRAHLAAYRTLQDRFKVTAIVDQNHDRIDEIRDGDDFAALSSISQALDDPSVDVIDICLPPHMHAEVTLEALRSGKHVICEKPLATSMADVDRIRVEAQSRNRMVFPVFQYRWGPALTKLRHLMAMGLTGSVNAAALETHWSRGADYYAVPWHGTWAGERGGAVLGQAIHNHDLLTHIAGPIASVSGRVATRANPIETDDTAALVFEMASGALCTSSITLGAAGNETRLRIVFEKLTAISGNEPYAPAAADWTFHARDPSDQAAVDAALATAPREPSGYAGFFTEAANCLSGAQHAAVQLDDGAASIELVTAIYHAARSGQSVALPLPPAHPLYDGWQP